MDDPLESQGYAERVATSDFHDETFRVLKVMEIKCYGEYRTRGFVVEAWARPEAKASSPRLTPAPLMKEPSPHAREAPTTEIVQNTLPQDKPLGGGAVPDPHAYTLFRCSACGQLVLAFDRCNHRSAHPGEAAWFERAIQKQRGERL